MNPDIQRLYPFDPVVSIGFPRPHLFVKFIQDVGQVTSYTTAFIPIFFL
jgi:hypothetical protein